MSDSTMIETCNATWNLWWGCYGPNGTEEKPDRCPYCYAHTLAKRKVRNCDLCREFVPHFHSEFLGLPGKWKKPRIVFVESMGDLAGEGVEYSWQAAVFNIMEMVRQHTYLVLTKRIDRMDDFLRHYHNRRIGKAEGDVSKIPELFPHVWFGVTITGNQDRPRLETLGRLPVAHRFVSYEPILDSPPIIFPEPLDVEGYINPKRVEWVIVGAQTGKQAKRPDYLWVQDVVAQCKAHNVPLFLKNSLHLGPGMRQFPPEMEGLKR